MKLDLKELSKLGNKNNTNHEPVKVTATKREQGTSRIVKRTYRLSYALVKELNYLKGMGKIEYINTFVEEALKDKIDKLK